MPDKQILSAKAVIFDMDGVITNTMPYHFQAWEIAFQDVLGLKISEKDIYLREGSKGSFALEEIFEQYGWSHDQDILKRLLDRKEEVFPTIVKIDFVPGALEFLDQLASQGFLMALVTGTSRDELEKMLPQHVQDLFSVMVTGSDVIHGKPNPEPYQKALAQLGIDADQAFVIENAPLGLRSAKTAQLRCIALETSLPKEFLSDADFIFFSFQDLNSAINFALMET